MNNQRIIEYIRELEITQFDKDTHKILKCSNQIKDSLISFLEKVSNSNEHILFYRGTIFEHLNDVKEECKFFERFFIVGEKAKVFLIKGGNRRTSEDAYNQISLEFLKRKLIKEYEDFDFEKLEEEEDDNIRILLLKAINHFLNVDANNSGMISTSQEFATAEHFSTENGSKTYIVIGYEEEKNTIDYHRIYEYVGVERQELLDDEKEIFIDGVIFPNKIIGLIKLQSPDSRGQLILNPWLVKKLSAGDVSSVKIAIDQNDFNKEAIALGYEFYTTDSTKNKFFGKTKISSKE